MQGAKEGIFSVWVAPRIQGLTSIGPLRESRGRFRPTRASRGARRDARGGKAREGTRDVRMYERERTVCSKDGRGNEGKRLRGEGGERVRERTLQNVQPV